MLQKILYNYEIAIVAIQRNKLRAFLTSLGIIFGVASVIAMLAIGTGAQQEILAQMQLLGTNNVIIKPTLEQLEGDVASIQEEKSNQKKYSPGLNLQDLKSIKEIMPEIEFISPEIVFETNFIRNARMRTGKVVGVNNEYFHINNFELQSGNNFSYHQLENAAPVCIIGADVRAKFFAGEDPIGKEIKVGNIWLKVIGVLEKKILTTESIESLGIRNYNLDIFTPATTLLLRLKNRGLITKDDLDPSAGSGMRVFIVGGDEEEEETDSQNYHQFDKLIVQVSDSRYSASIAEVLARMLTRRHNGVVDFEIIVPEQLLQQEQRTKRIFNIVLSSIASISLIVGGIGIMNIMLASVVERYREIGVRMAVGAQKRDIELQFLTEALAISITGGFIGIILGIGFSTVIEMTAEISTVVTPMSIIISFGVALIIGVIFGYFPAKRAAQQDPVHALRHE